MNISATCFFFLSYLMITMLVRFTQVSIGGLVTFSMHDYTVSVCNNFSDKQDWFAITNNTVLDVFIPGVTHESFSRLPLEIRVWIKGMCIFNHTRH